MAKKGGLGKGLDAIFYDNAREDDAGAVELSICLLYTSPSPRD